MQPIHGNWIKQLTQLTEELHGQLHQATHAQEYLEKRGLKPAINGHRLGYVNNPPEGWDRYKGYISIPFHNPDGEVVCIRFRKLDPPDPDNAPKYLQPSGTATRLFNMPALMSNTDTIVITEGEIDCMTLEVMGINAVGVTGATSFKPWYAGLVEGFHNIIVWGDPDKAGQEFNEKVIKTVRRAVPAHLSTDINDSYLEDGGLAIMEAYENAGGTVDDRDS